MRPAPALPPYADRPTSAPAVYDLESGRHLTNGQLAGHVAESCSTCGRYFADRSGRRDFYAAPPTCEVRPFGPRARVHAGAPFSRFIDGATFRARAAFCLRVAGDRRRAARARGRSLFGSTFSAASLRAMAREWTNEAACYSARARREGVLP